MDRIECQQDVNGNYTLTTFRIGTRSYTANTIGTDVWDIRGADNLAVSDAARDRLRDIVRSLLEADELNTLRRAS